MRHIASFAIIGTIAAVVLGFAVSQVMPDQATKPIVAAIAAPVGAAIGATLAIVIKPSA